MISVAIATLDRPEDVRRCVASILDGDKLPLEVLVVDQSGDDRTRRVVDSFGSDLVRRIPQERAPLPVARNRAAREARGEYVAFVDDDAELPPHWIASIEAELERFDMPDALYGEILNPPGRDAGGLIVSLRFDAPVVWPRGSHPSSLGWGGHMIVRRATCERLGGFDERLGAGSPLYCAEDVDFNYRLLTAGGRAVSTPAFHMVHHHHNWRETDRLPVMWYRYSVGNAAFTMKYLLRGDRYAAYMLGRQAASDLKLLVKGLRRRSRLQARVAVQRARGTGAGVVAGWRAFR